MSGPLPRRLALWAVGTEASSRSSALIRIGLVLLIWSRFGGHLTLPLAASPEAVAFSLCFFAATMAMGLGLFARLTSLATGLLVLFYYYYVGVVLDSPGVAHHHTYLLGFATLLCSLTPCDRSYSLDRWRAVRRAEREGRPDPPERGNVWGLRLIALQLSLIYLWSAFDKVDVAFLNGFRLERIYLFHYVNFDPPTGSGFHALAVLASWGTLALECSLGVGLLFARTRRWLLVPGLLFHAVLYVALPVRTFSATMALLYLAYLDPDVVHARLDRLQGAAHAMPRRVEQGSR